MFADFVVDQIKYANDARGENTTHPKIKAIINIISF